MTQARPPGTLAADIPPAFTHEAIRVQAMSQSPAGQPAGPPRAGLVLVTLILAAGIANINLAVADVALPDIGKARA